jgi:hypothetical protein
VQTETPGCQLVHTAVSGDSSSSPGEKMIGRSAGIRGGTSSAGTGPSVKTRRRIRPSGTVSVTVRPPTSQTPAAQPFSCPAPLSIANPTPSVFEWLPPAVDRTTCEPRWSRPEGRGRRPSLHGATDVRPRVPDALPLARSRQVGAMNHATTQMPCAEVNRADHPCKLVRTRPSRPQDRLVPGNPADADSDHDLPLKNDKSRMQSCVAARRFFRPCCRTPSRAPT